MKKADFIQFLAKRTDKTIPEAELLLNDLVELGMVPPRLPQLHCQALMTIYYAGYTFHQWEEDFDKDEKAVEALNKINARLARVARKHPVT